MEKTPGCEIIQKNINQASKYTQKGNVKELMRKSTLNSSFQTPSHNMKFEEYSLSSLENPDEKGQFVFKDNILQKPSKIKVEDFYSNSNLNTPTKKPNRFERNIRKSILKTTMNKLQNEMVYDSVLKYKQKFP